MSADAIQADLALRVTLKSAKRIEPGNPIELEIALVNQSHRASHWVVKPGDGSEAGWREPHVHLTGQIERSPGSWQDLPVRPVLRCGLFDMDWGKDAVLLKPGGKLPLKSWLPAPEQRLDLQEAGRVRLFAHYVYRAGVGQRSGQKPPAAMAAVPAFEIVSAPVELQVERPLDLVMTARQPLKAGQATPLSSVLAVQLINRSDQPREVAAHANGGHLGFEVEGSPAGPVPHLDNHQGQGEHPQQLAAGATLTLLGAGATPPVDNTWQFPKAGTLKVRAVYNLYRRGAIVNTLRSPWVDVQVTP